MNTYSQIFQLTETSGVAYRPRWSPDARFIAWLYYDPDTDAIDFWLTDNLSESSRPISTGSIGEPDLRSFGWSPDSRLAIIRKVERATLRYRAILGQVLAF
jgi:tricorn protease-like protein